MHCHLEVVGRFDAKEAWGSPTSGMQVKHTSKDELSLDRLGPQYYRNSSAQIPCRLQERNAHFELQSVEKSCVFRGLTLINSLSSFLLQTAEKTNTNVEIATIIALALALALHRRCRMLKSGHMREMILLLSARQNPSGAFRRRSPEHHSGEGSWKRCGMSVGAAVRVL